MVKTLDPILREARKVVRAWEKEMMPIVQLHENRDKFSEPPYFNVTRKENCVGIDFCNFDNFFMSASYVGGAGSAEFIYARGVRPFVLEKDGHAEMVLANKLVETLQDVAPVFGFNNVRVIQDGDPFHLCRGPGVYFSGEDMDADKFGDYLNLVRFADTLADAYQIRADLEIDRPHKYVLVQHSTLSGYVAIKEFNCAGDLVEACAVLESAIPLELSREREMAYAPSKLEVNFTKERAKVLSVDDYVAGR